VNIIVPVPSELDLAFKQGGLSGAQMDEFLRLLDKFDLGFNWATLWRKMEYPRQRGYRDMEPSIYYFVPGTEFGQATLNKHPTKFVYSAVGVGLTFGCPLRLYYALKALVSLGKAEQKSCLSNLRNRPQHLSTIEELLWPGGFKANAPAKRGPGTVDWEVQTDAGRLCVEVKYKPSDWARVADAGFIHNDWITKAAKQLGPKCEGSYNVVGITTFTEVDRAVISQVKRGLHFNQNVDALVVKPIKGGFLVCSRSASLTSALMSVLRPNANRWPIFYPFLFPWKERDDRAQKRAPSNYPLVPVSEWSIQCGDGELRDIGGLSIGSVDGHVHSVGPFAPYRATIEYQGEEPLITVIPPRLGAE
jgi:hypothetical protein